MLPLSFVIPSAVSAAGPIAISEISTVGSADHEWIEIRNITDAPVDVTGWKFLEAGVNHGLKAVQGGAVIAGGIRAIIAEDASVFLTDHASSTLMVLDSTWGSLSTDGEQIGLKNASGTPVEMFTYPKTDGVIARRDDSADPIADDWCVTETASPGEENACSLSVPGLPADVSGLLLSEFLPEPAEGGEWVEIWNGAPSPAGAACELRDATGRIATIVEDVGPMSYAIVPLPSSKLNNDGDTVSLACGTETLDAVTYGDDPLDGPGPGRAIARGTLPDGAWAITTEPTPGTANRVVAPPASRGRGTSKETASRSYPRGRVLVNELFPGQAGQSWIELANPEPHALSLTGWMLVVDASSPIALSGTLPGDGFSVARAIPALRDEGGIAFLVDPEGYTTEQVIWGSGDGDGRDNAPTQTRAGTSIARVFDAFSSGNDADDFAETTTPTPGKPNEATPLLVGASPLSLSEVLPNPDGPDETGEFIEVENMSSSSVALDGWTIARGSGKPTVLPDRELAPGERLAIGRDVFRFALPNAGGRITLVAPDGSRADDVSYGAAESGAAYARAADAWGWTVSPTPGSANIMRAPDHAPKAALVFTAPEAPGEPYAFDATDSFDEDGPLARVLWDFGDGTADGATSTDHLFDAPGKYRITLAVWDGHGASSTTHRTLTVPKRLFDDQEEPESSNPATKKSSTRKAKTKTTAKQATVVGVALAEIGALAASAVPIQTADDIVVLEIPKGMAKVTRGDIIQASGSVVMRSGEERVRAKTIVRKSGVVPTSTIFVSIADTAEAHPYSLATVEGTVVDRTNALIALSHDGEIPVRLPTRLKDRAAFAVGAVVRATGILKPGKTGDLELVARDAEDLALIASAPLPPAPPRTEMPLSPAGAGATGAAGGVLLSAGWTASSLWRQRIAGVALRVIRPT